jgi:hypothetical protein
MSSNGKRTLRCSSNEPAKPKFTMVPFGWFVGLSVAILPHRRPADFVFVVPILLVPPREETLNNLLVAAHGRALN